MLIITGAPRTGQSVLAQYLLKSGFRPSQNASPKTAFEDPNVTQINNAILAAGGMAWNHAPNGCTCSSNGAIDYSIASYLSANPNIDFLKDPRFAFTWPVWERALNEIDLFVSFREPGETALSIRRIFAGRVSEALTIWQQYYARLATVNAAFVEFGANVEFDDYSDNLGRAFRFLDIDYLPACLAKLFDKHMIHIRDTTSVHPTLKKLYDLLRARTEN